MRVPLTLSELSVIRSGGRIFFQLIGVFGVLILLWGATIMIDRSVESMNNPDDLPTGEFVPSLRFPADTVLTHRDGRALSAMLINRPSSKTVTIQRKSDGRTFTIALKDLSEASQEEVRRYALESESSSLQAMIDSFQSHLTLPETSFEFPHPCTLVSVEGVALPVTLLHRESESSIRFRRMKDRKVFTIPLTRVVESDRELIRQFPIGHVEPPPLRWDD